jgi:hypothetical protein
MLAGTNSPAKVDVDNRSGRKVELPGLTHVTCDA